VHFSDERGFSTLLAEQLQRAAETGVLLAASPSSDAGRQGPPWAARGTDLYDALRTTDVFATAYSNAAGTHLVVRTVNSSGFTRPRAWVCGGRAAGRGPGAG